jgi:hypothetical protein
VLTANCRELPARILPKPGRNPLPLVLGDFGLAGGDVDHLAGQRLSGMSTARMRARAMNGMVQVKTFCLSSD